MSFGFFGCNYQFCENFRSFAFFIIEVKHHLLTLQIVATATTFSCKSFDKITCMSMNIEHSNNMPLYIYLLSFYIECSTIHCSVVDKSIKLQCKHTFDNCSFSTKSYHLHIQEKKIRRLPVCVCLFFVRSL